MRNFIYGIGEIRTKRQNELKDSDWTQLPNAPLSLEKKQSWEEYRQALRDVTKQETYPAFVDFPIRPEA